MTEPYNPSQNTSTYLMNPEDAVEAGRLMLQDSEATRSMGSLFPADLIISQVHTVLDLACGPGGWVLDVARTYPDIDVIGTDISQKMIRYAQAQSGVLGLPNASFQVMDILKPLGFPNDAFEFVNIRGISGFMPRIAWVPLMQECLRVTCAGGIIRITDGDWWETNSSACQKFTQLATRAMWLDGKTFSRNGERNGVMLMLGQLFRDAGLTNIRHQANVIEFSYGTESYEPWYQNLMMAHALLRPFLLKMGVTTPEELDQLYEQATKEMQDPDFRAILFSLSVWGTKPAQT